MGFLLGDFWEIRFIVKKKSSQKRAHGLAGFLAFALLLCEALAHGTAVNRKRQAYKQITHVRTPEAQKHCIFNQPESTLPPDFLSWEIIHFPCKPILIWVFCYLALKDPSLINSPNEWISVYQALY